MVRRVGFGGDGAPQRRPATDRRASPAPAPTAAPPRGEPDRDADGATGFGHNSGLAGALVFAGVSVILFPVFLSAAGLSVVSAIFAETGPERVAALFLLAVTCLLVWVTGRNALRLVRRAIHLSRTGRNGTAR